MYYDVIIFGMNICIIRFLSVQSQHIFNVCCGIVAVSSLFFPSIFVMVCSPINGGVYCSINVFYF